MNAATVIELSMVRKDAGDLSIALGNIASPMHSPSKQTPMTSHTRAKTPSPRSGIAGASFNLLNATIGAGVVALPFAIKECGFIMGTLLLIVLAFVMDRCIILLIECGIKLGIYNLEELCLVLFGPAGYNLACIVMMMYSIGSMIACQVVIGDTLPWCLHTLFKVNMNVFTREAVMIVVAVLLVLPLCLLKNVSTLSSASLLSVVAVLLLVLIVVVHGPSEMNRQGLTYEIATDTTIVSPNVLSGIATISFHYVCQQSCFLMFRSLEQPTLVNWKKVSHFSIGFTMTMTLLLSICGYVYFTDSVNGNVLNNFAELDGVITVARLFMAVNMVLTIPMECFIVRHAVFSICNRYYPLKELPLPVDSSSHMNSSSASNTSWGNASYSEQAIEERSDGRSWEAVGTRGMGEDLEILPDNDETEWNSIAHILVTIALWSSTLGFALLFQDLSVVLAFSGILAASMLGFVLPAMIILKTYMVPIKHMLQMRGFIAITSLPSSALDMDSAWREIRLKDAGDVSTQGDASSSQDLMANFLFSAFLGIFGLFILVMGLVMEIYHLSRGEEYVDPTTNY